MKLPKGRSAKEEQSLMADLWDAQLANDLEAFVLYVYPWKKQGTPLADIEGPRAWQRDFLQEITDHIRTQRQRIAQGLPPTMLKMARSSGRGIGKSAIMSWLQHWMQSTVLGSSVLVSANTEDQLTKVTWGEFGIWQAMAINNHWFDFQATSIKPAEWFSLALKEQLHKGGPYYQTTQKIWSETNPNAFAGPHNQDGMMLLFDEASGIPETIWNIGQGYFTEPVLHRYWFAFSQSRDNQAKFVKIFGEDDWKTKRIDARTVEGTDQALYQSIVNQHGEDGDVTRVEVKGLPPKQGQNQFISKEFIDLAFTRETIADDTAPLIIGLDPARFGDDSSVIAFRQGRNARCIEWIAKNGYDQMALANVMQSLITRYNPDAVCIDSGMGSGVIDRLRELRFKVHEVQFGSSSPDDQWEDFRTYIWAEMRDWLRDACIPKIRRLADDLAGPGYEFTGKDVIKLEAKKKMKARGIPSPDYGDALACTFAVKLAHRDLRSSRANSARQARDVDYNIFG